MLGTIFHDHPKVRPLTTALIAAATEQGATVEEFTLACEGALSIVRKATDRSKVLIPEFTAEIKTILDGVQEKSPFD